jgi:multicomponent Na+:H+ antiporter subunit G
VTALDLVTLPLLLAAAFFFLSGTVGLLRFPDLYTRLHALTKADNLGLGLVALALAIRSGSLAVAAKLLLAWLLALVASSTSCHLVARAARRAGVPAATGTEKPR